MNFDTLAYSNLQYSMVMLTFTVLDWKNSFLANLVKKSRIVSFSSNVESRPFRIVFNGDIHFIFLDIFGDVYFTFLVNFAQHFKIVCLSLHFPSRFIWTFCEFDGEVYCFCFRMKIWPLSNLNGLFKFKFRTESNSNG